MMSDVNLIRKKVHQARELAQQGKYAQAKTLLKGIDHPKVAALIAELDGHFAGQQPARKLPLHVIGIGCAMLLTMIVGIGLVVTARATQPEVVLPTFLPTADCTSETIQTWWQAQETGLSQFAADASSASRTMPGERLTTQIDSLRQFRDNFPTLPACSSSDLQLAVADLLTALDATILAAQHWNDGITDGTQATQEFYTAEKALKQDQIRIRHLVSQAGAAGWRSVRFVSGYCRLCGGVPGAAPVPGAVSPRRAGQPPG
jgi:hypothetical protein